MIERQAAKQKIQVKDTRKYKTSYIKEKLKQKKKEEKTKQDWDVEKFEEQRKKDEQDQIEEHNRFIKSNPKPNLSEKRLQDQTRKGQNDLVTRHQNTVLKTYLQETQMGKEAYVDTE